MNWMNINEYVFASCESLCFVTGKIGCFAHKYAFLTVFYITNAIAAPKKQFIKVHLVHRKVILERLFYILMNLMNFDVLTYYLWLLFAMDKRGMPGNELVFMRSSSSIFIKFIKEAA